MMTNQFWSCVGLSIVGMVATAPCRAQDAQPTGPTAAQQWVQARQAEFAEYRFRRESERAVALTMQPHSILNWSNPERGTDSGAVFLWTEEGRPQMIACAFEFGGLLKHEFQSLSTEPIAAQRGTSEVHRFGPGVEWQLLAKAPPPATQRPLRLTQMRRQADRFRAQVGSSPTRLLTQPVYRSPADAEEDIAAFLFVQGTDPELTLLLAISPEKEWRYALARQTKWGLKVELDGAPLWSQSSAAKAKADSPFIVIPQKTVTAGQP